MNLDEKPRPAAFYPHSQHRGFLYNFVARYTGDRKSLVPRIRKAVSEIDPNLAVADFLTLAQVVDDSIALQRLVAQLSTLFGILAALLACLAANALILPLGGLVLHIFGPEYAENGHTTLILLCIAGLGLIFLLHYLDDRLYEPEEVEEQLGIPVLADLRRR